MGDSRGSMRDGALALPMVLGILCGATYKTMYVLNDYSGAVDAWVCDQSMVPGCYAHFRVEGVSMLEDWYRCQRPMFMGYVQGEPAMLPSRV